MSKTCILCKEKFNIWEKIDGKPRNLNNRKSCLKCTPWKTHGKNTRDSLGFKLGKRLKYKKTKELCDLCGKNKTPRKWCKSCIQKIRRFQGKEKAIEILGGKCNRCKWFGSQAGFEFHHPNNDKLFNVGNVSGRSWEIIKNEILKCELLCSICHRIEHSTRDDIKLIKAAKEYRN